jgi:hypothetical protein
VPRRVTCGRSTTADWQRASGVGNLLYTARGTSLRAARQGRMAAAGGKGERWVCPRRGWNPVKLWLASCDKGCVKWTKQRKNEWRGGETSTTSSTPHSLLWAHLYCYRELQQMRHVARIKKSKIWRDNILFDNEPHWILIPRTQSGPILFIQAAGFCRYVFVHNNNNNNID